MKANKSTIFKDKFTISLLTTIILFSFFETINTKDRIAKPCIPSNFTSVIQYH